MGWKSEHWESEVWEIKQNPTENHPTGSIHCLGFPELWAKHREVEATVSTFEEFLVYGGGETYPRKQLETNLRQCAIGHQREDTC